MPPIFSTTLYLALKPDKSIIFIITIIHFIVSLVIAMVMDKGGVWLGIIFFSIGISYLYFMRLHVTLSLKKSVSRVSMNTLGEFFIISKTKKMKVTLLKNSFSSQHLLILNFLSDNGKHPVLITKSRVGNNNFRALKVRLRTL
ncbi:MAG: hypothetical protein KAG28_03045 [Cocleimonas sp.]|nr:hypothetical protein [Cocleimonas sp.]